MYTNEHILLQEIADSQDGNSDLRHECTTFLSLLKNQHPDEQQLRIIAFRMACKGENLRDGKGNSGATVSLLMQQLLNKTFCQVLFSDIQTWSKPSVFKMEELKKVMEIVTRIDEKNKISPPNIADGVEFFKDVLKSNETKLW